MLIQLIAVAALLVSSPAKSGSSYSGRPQIQVEVRATTGEILAGTVVSLCPIARDHPEIPQPQDPAYASCKVAGTDLKGVVSFKALKPGYYAITADANGFAITTVYPLSIAGPDPIAPDKLTIVLNPTCNDCVSHRTGDNH